ncbi:MAG: hypothetical protein ABI193_16010 [Minicystis sp.]
MTKKILTGMALCLGLCAVAESAQAEPTKKDDSYGYEFKDDVLNADSSIATGVRIQVRPRGTRERLLRPRTHFVAEMLKSVENM